MFSGSDGAGGRLAILVAWGRLREHRALLWAPRFFQRLWEHLLLYLLWQKATVVVLSLFRTPFIFLCVPQTPEIGTSEQCARLPV